MGREVYIKRWLCDIKSTKRLLFSATNPQTNVIVTRTKTNPLIQESCKSGILKP